ncbi:MAG: FadR/GntR family transcriptional regulator [Paracoccaceae bacterium]
MFDPIKRMIGTNTNIGSTNLIHWSISIDNMAGPDNKDALSLLRTMIAEGGWAPGGRLPSERALTQKLNVGRSSLRRAFDTLEREGLIWRRVGQGTFVSEGPTESAFEDIQKMSENITPMQLLRARLALEPMIAREAAINATEVDIRSIEEAMTVAESAATWNEYAIADDKFHLLIANATQNPLLTSMFSYLNTIRRAVSWSKVQRSSVGPVIGHPSFLEHQKITTSIKEREANAAVNVMRSHLYSVSQRLFGES